MAAQAQAALGRQNEELVIGAGVEDGDSECDGGARWSVDVPHAGRVVGVGAGIVGGQDGAGRSRHVGTTVLHKGLVGGTADVVRHVQGAVRAATGVLTCRRLIDY